MIIYTDGSPKHVAYMINGIPYVEKIEFSTNFEAEYKSIIAAMHKLGILYPIESPITILNDNAVVIAQLKGQAKVRAENLIPLYNTVKMLRNSFHGKVYFDWVGRKQNPAGRILE